MGRIVCLLVAMLAAMGCTLHHRPADFAIDPGSIPPLPGAEAVTVTRGQVSAAARSRLSVPSYTVTVDYLEYTDAAVDRLRAELLRSGIAVSGHARNTLRLAVAYVTIVRSAGSFSCVIDFSVETGDGYRKGHQARAHSWDFRKACNAAISNIVVVTLNDPKVRAYLSGSITKP